MSPLSVRLTAQKSCQLTASWRLRCHDFFPQSEKKDRKTYLAHQGKFPRVAATESVTAAPGEISAPCFMPPPGAARVKRARGVSFCLSLPFSSPQGRDIHFNNDRSSSILPFTRNRWNNAIDLFNISKERVTI